MKVDEASINHNALRKIKEITDLIYEPSGDKEQDKFWRDAYLYEIHGIVEMAETMKEILFT